YCASIDLDPESRVSAEAFRIVCSGHIDKADGEGAKRRVLTLRTRLGADRGAGFALHVVLVKAAYADLVTGSRNQIVEVDGGLAGASHLCVGQARGHFGLDQIADFAICWRYQRIPGNDHL